MEKIIPFPGAQNASATSFEALIEPHVDYVFRLAYRFTGRRADAEDLVQDVLIKVFAQWRELARMEKQRAWLARVTYHTYVDTHRRNTRSPLSQGIALAGESDDEAGVTLAAEADTAEEVANGINHVILERALAQLPPEQRALVTLHDIEGYTLNELENLLDSPLGTLKSRLHRARARMREILETMGTF